MGELTIYRVTTDADIEGRSRKTLGYCTGSEADIRAYFDDLKGYDIYLEKVEAFHVDAELVRERTELLRKKKELEQHLASINNRL